jgi:hypothetical protein
MANTVFKLRRSSVAGKQPNTSTLTIGELGINLTDKILYSSDGGDVFEIGANLTTLSVANLTVTGITVNSSILSVNTAISANGSNGTAGQVLTTNSTGVYWSTVTGGGGSANADAQYTWTNTQTFQNTITFSSTINGTVNNATYLTGNSVSDLNTYASDKAANAYSNAVSSAASDASTKAGTAYTNATSYADTKAGTAYTNAVSYVDTKIGTANTAITGNAATAYTNAVSYTDTKIGTANTAITGNAATAYTNAVSYVDTKIGTANTAITGNAATAYTNAVSYTDSKILTANGAITGNAATAYTNAVAAIASSTANNANNLGGVAASSYQLNSTLSANVATLTSNNANHVIYANYKTVTASPNTVLANDSLILVNMTANSTINLPAASTTNGSIINIKNINTGYVSIIPNGSDTIDGQANLVIQYQYSAAGLISTSTGWAIV